MILDADNLPPDLRGECFNIQFQKMEIGIPEQIDLNPDGSYTIFLNTRYSQEQWFRSMQHAFDHVRRRDWERDDVQEIESAAHK